MITTSTHTHTLPALVSEEQEVLDRVLPALRALQAQEGARESELVTRTRELHREWTNARGDVSQRAAFEEALEEATRSLQSHRTARRSREVSPGTPYFGRMVLVETKRRQEVLIGKVGVVERGLTICDWRDAPISQLYYAYDEGDEYEEEIAGREREGVLLTRRRVDVREGALVEVQRGEETLRLRPDGGFGAVHFQQIFRVILITVRLNPLDGDFLYSRTPVQVFLFENRQRVFKQRVLHHYG